MEGLDKKIKSLTNDEWKLDGFRTLDMYYESEVYKVINLLKEIVILQNEKIEALQSDIESVTRKLEWHEDYKHAHE